MSSNVPSFDQFGKCVVVDRDSAENLLSMLGCVNTEKWDTDFLVRSLHRVSVFKGCGEVSEAYRPLLEALGRVGTNGIIVVRSSKRPVNKPIAFTDRVFTKPSSRSGNSTIKRKKRVRGETFSFHKCGIPVGAVLILKKDPSITCTVVGDPWRVDFHDGVEKSFTERTRDLIGSKESTYLSPMHYWMYNGQLLRVYYRNIQCKGKKKVKDNNSTKEKGMVQNVRS